MEPSHKTNTDHRADDHAAFMRLAFVLASEYESIYMIHSADDSYVKYCPDSVTHSLIRRGEGSDFYEALRNLCRACVLREEQAEFLHRFSRVHLMEALAKEKSFESHVRCIVGEEIIYYDVRVFPCAAQETIVLCIRNADAEMRRMLRIHTEHKTFRQIISALSGRYEVIYYVNIETGGYTEYSSSETYSRLEVSKTGTDFFSDTQRNLKPDIYPDDYPMMREAMRPENLLGSIRENGSASLNYRLMLDGDPKFVTLYATHPKDDPAHLIIAVANVDADVRRELAYREALGSAIALANQDALTGVKNKYAYQQREAELDAVIRERKNQPFAVVFCDINGLKHINDTEGHTAGDAYIRSASRILCTVFSHSPVYRIGGDEFVVLLEGADYHARESLMQQLAEAVEKNRRQRRVTVSSGISVFQAAEDSCVRDVFERADHAMYEQKKNYRCITGADEIENLRLRCFGSSPTE